MVVTVDFDVVVGWWVITMRIRKCGMKEKEKEEEKEKKK